MTPDEIGERVQFRDTKPDGSVVVREGVVNGPAVGGFIPVFAGRGDGREATTIYVAPSNYLGPVAS